MNITKRKLDDAVRNEILSAEQALLLLVFLQAKSDNESRFDLSNILYYLGGFVAVGAAAVFAELAWHNFGGAGVFFISLLYGFAGLKITSLFQHKGFDTPAGVCAVFVVAMAPLVVYGLQSQLGLFANHYYGSYDSIIELLPMQLTTLIVGLGMLQRYKYPFLMMPIATSFFLIALNVMAIVWGEGTQSFITIGIGLLMIFAAFYVDLKIGRVADYAFWLYLLGATAFWLPLTFEYNSSEIYKYIYLFSNISLVLIGVVLSRRIFGVLGVIGTILFFGDLMGGYYKSWAFPIILTIVGVLFVYIGYFWQKNKINIERKLKDCLLVGVAKVLDDN